MVDGGGISAQAAATEVLRRRRARSSLVDYSRAITIPGAPVSDDPEEWIFKPIETIVSRHHVVTMQAIERCIRADYGRLMIFEPPGSAKSTYASVVGTTWAMGAFPGLRVLMTSYAGTPITRHSKRARQIVASPEYRSIWAEPTTLVGGSTAADEWELTNGSGMYAAGLLGGLTSSRCDLGIIDDPVAGREEADSETIRVKTRAAYDDDFLTRLKPGASIVLIQTRWHQDDLAGGILPEDYDGRSGPVLCRDGQTWEVLNIAAKCERTDDPVGREIGEYLWPEWFTDQHWRIFEANSRTWSALYQQRPVPHSGIYFKREDFKRFARAPDGLRMYLSSDFAVRELRAKSATSKGSNPDFTEHGVFGIDHNGEIWITAWWSGQKQSDVTVDAAIDLVAAHKPVLWLGESGVIESAIEPSIKKRMQQRSTYAARLLLPSIADKVARSVGFSGRVSAGTVHVFEGAWGDALIDQLVAFPAGRHDDKVDVCSLIGRALDELADALPPPPAKLPPPAPFTEPWFAARDRADSATDAEKQRYYR